MTPSADARPHILTLAKLPALMVAPLQAAFVVHDRPQEGDAASFAAIAGRIRAVAGGGESKLPRALMNQLPALEVVSVMGVGYDGVDVAAALERGIPVTHTPGVLNDEVADLAIGLVLSVARRIPQADRYVRAGRWANEGPMPLARKVSGARLGIVGLGRIGQAIASRAQAFGMSIAYTSRNPRPDSGYTYYRSALELAAQVDFLVAITPGGDGTRHLINAEVLQALGPAGYLVNVARGSVVDEAALVDALQKGVIAGAGLDVFEDEPRPLPALLALENVVLTPHMASATLQTRTDMANLAVDNLKAHFAGQPLLTPVPEWTARRTAP
ncbi:MAG: 2-hydroxyacid dehydrogenase [Haliea sp.]|nr:MAG: 2-hydroxyacid dehydrogenase [Haliea sp.]